MRFLQTWLQNSHPRPLSQSTEPRFREEVHHELCQGTENLQENDAGCGDGDPCAAEGRHDAGGCQKGLRGGVPRPAAWATSDDERRGAPAGQHLQFDHGQSGDILVQKAPACTIETLARATKALFDPEDKIPVKVIGIRHGEKMYETLLTNEECAHAIDLGNFYRVPADQRDLNYDKYFKDGDAERNTLTEFTSANTRLMTVNEVRDKLLTLEYIQEELAKE